MITWQITTVGTCQSLDEVPRNARITKVNRRVCIGICEVCGKPVLEGQDFVHDSRGYLLHGRCGKIYVKLSKILRPMRLLRRAR